MVFFPPRSVFLRFPLGWFQFWIKNTRRKQNNNKRKKNNQTCHLSTPLSDCFITSRLPLFPNREWYRWHLSELVKVGNLDWRINGQLARIKRIIPMLYPTMMEHPWNCLTQPGSDPTWVVQNGTPSLSTHHSRCCYGNVNLRNKDGAPSPGHQPLQTASTIKCLGTATLEESWTWQQLS